jgi:alkylated DNA repair dioxygenase AlkB
VPEQSPNGPAVGTAEPSIRPDAAFERIPLDDRSWVDVARGWLDGQAALLDVLQRELTWETSRVYRYDHWVEEPHLGAGFRLDAPPHPALLDAHRTLQHHYHQRFMAPSLVLYRDGRDSMAFHRDRDLRWLDDTLVALLVLGERRPFHIRPRANRYAHELAAKGATHDVAAGRGDLLVMGGACQAGWEHSVPKVPGHRGVRVSIQWRWAGRTGRPVEGASYRAPRHYSR